MATPVIRLARDTDAHPIAVMSRCLIEVGLRGWSWDPSRVARAIHNRNTCVAVAEVDHKIAGFAIAEFGDTYREYMARVPAFFPRLNRLVGSPGDKPSETRRS